MHRPADELLLKKFINNACTKEELEQVRLLFKEPGTEALIQETLNEKWIDVPEKLAGEKQMQDWKAEFQDRIKTKEATVIPLKVKATLLYLKYAAAIAVAFIGIGIVLLRSKKDQTVKQIAMREIINPTGRRSKIILSDSSVVYLGAASKLRFPEKFTGDTRALELEGEAFFEVVHKDQQPMVVRTGVLQARDLGTSFKVTAFKNTAYRVEVTSGKVGLEQLINKKFIPIASLNPGEMVLWEKGSVKKGRTTISDVNQWKDGRLVFNNIPIADLAKEIERFYGVNIKFNNASIAKMRITTVLTIADTPVSKIMNALSASAHFNYTIKGSEILIK